MSDLQACPFGCEQKPGLNRWIFGAQIICRECGAKGPVVDNGRGDTAAIRKAERLWNRRAAPKADAGLVEALKFYAEPKNYLWRETGTQNKSDTIIEEDQGDRARSALASLQGKEGGGA